MFITILRIMVKRYVYNIINIVIIGARVYASRIVTYTRPSSGYVRRDRLLPGRVFTETAPSARARNLR